MSGGLRAAPALRGGERGQATVELVALVPLVAAIALLVGGLLAGQRVREAADAAAGAAAVAELQGRDAAAAAHTAVPPWARVRLTVRGGVARASVRWRGPRPLADLVDADREVVFAPRGRR